MGTGSGMYRSVLLACALAVCSAYLEDKCRRKAENPSVAENPKQYYLVPQRDDSLQNCTHYKHSTCCKPEAIEYISQQASWPGGNGVNSDCPIVQMHLNCFPCSPKAGSATRVCKTMCDQIYSKCGPATVAGEPEPRTRIVRRRQISTFNSSAEVCKFIFGDTLIMDNDDNDCLGYIELHERNNPANFIIWLVIGLIIVCGGAYLLFVAATTDGEPGTPNPSAKGKSAKKSGGTGKKSGKK